MRVPCAQLYTFFADFELLAGKSVNLCKHVNMYAHKTAWRAGAGQPSGRVGRVGLTLFLTTIISDFFPPTR